MAAAATVAPIPPTAVGPPSMASHQQASPPQQDRQQQEVPRPYKCQYCDKAFHRLEHQTRHTRTHTGEKPHACAFPGCTKRFSRSDELTRHTRIHNNPNSRRGTKSQNAAAQAAAQLGAGRPVDHMSYTVNAPHHIPHAYSHSNPASTLASPNISPPQSYSAYPNGAPMHHTGYSSPNGMPRPQQQMDINLLATAASQVQREDEMAPQAYPQPHVSRPHHRSSLHGHHGHHNHHGHHSSHHHSHQFHPYSGHHHPSSRLPSLSEHAYGSASMSRSHSYEGDDAVRPYKRSRPSSPQSTAPSSPNLSCDSCSPTPNQTPGHTPALTPAHSPRLRPHGHHHDVQLPGIRHLSLQYTPSSRHPEPMEPSTEHMSHTPYSRSANSSSMRISDIVNNGPDGRNRTLPMPDILNH